MSPGSDFIARNDSGTGATGEYGVGCKPTVGSSGGSSLTAGNGGGSNLSVGNGGGSDLVNDSAAGSDYFWQKKGR